MAHQRPPHQSLSPPLGGGTGVGAGGAGERQLTDKLQGVVPTMFNGNRNKSKDFL
jgi:hypothetical protein